MFKPSRRYRRRTASLRKVLLISLIIFSILTAWGTWMVNEKMKPAVMSIALTQAEQIGNYAINYGIGESALVNIHKDNDPNELPLIDANKLIETYRNEQNELTAYELNSEEASRVKGSISNRILWFLRMAEKGQISLTNGPSKDLEYHKAGKGEGIIADIPLGQVLDNALLSNYGPRVPVDMEIVSNVKTDFRLVEKNVGINNVVIHLYLYVTVKVDVIVPFAIKTEAIKQHIPIDSIGFKSDVPYYYHQGEGSGLSPALPIEKAPKSDKKNEK
ncbi:sporulation protein YunB [Sporolactobacillus sp. THM7-7]|nr:sporulation protein YunB [Sporolactobacillus sp. THM7-7]